MRQRLEGDALKRATDLMGSAVGGGARGGGRGVVAAGPETLSSVPGSLATLMRQLEAADAAPTTQLVAAIADRRAQLTGLLVRLEAWKKK